MARSAHGGCGGFLPTFIKDREDFFAKEVDSFGGQGVSRVFCWKSIPDASALYHQLRGRGQYLVEETIRQHPEMERLHPGSINTLRVVTLLTNGGTLCDVCTHRVVERAVH